MKQMTKEELIEYFIEQLGDNKILGEIMSIEQIREKLSNILEFVDCIYEPNGPQSYMCSHVNGKCSITYNFAKIGYDEQDATIIHEVLHVLSASTKKYLLE